MRILLLIAVSFVTAAGINGQRSIRDVDFKNFTYTPFCTGETPDKITVANGEFSEEKQEDGYVDRFYFKVYAPEYGDLTGDRREEAVVLSVCNTGGTGNFSEGYVFGISEGVPRLLARIPGGDRAYGGLRSAVIRNGRIIVESNDVGELGGACCPEFIVTTAYRLQKEGLSAIGVPERREIFPVERVSFARGTTGKAIRVKIPSDEGRRFVVGARAGQSLIVSVDTGDVSLRLLDEADVSFEERGLRARLPRSGDYTIEVRNGGTEEREISVKISIQ